MKIYKAGVLDEAAILHLTEPSCRNNPVEVLETEAPWIIETYKMRQDSGGAGKYRGGVGVTRTYRFLHPSTTLTLVKKTKSGYGGVIDPASITVDESATAALRA